MNKIEVAKFGGTSMNHPELVAGILTAANNNMHSVIVSAPGTGENAEPKLTSMLVDYENTQDTKLIKAIKDRLAVIAARLNNVAVDKIVNDVATDIDVWQTKDMPVSALGEYWSAQIFACITGREFVDPRELIIINDDRSVNGEKTHTLVKERLKLNGKYVIPGFYGAGANGSTKTLQRGGSDISGAIIAVALGAAVYHNWSDVDGFYTADPRFISDAKIVDTLTYKEARELGNGGNGLLHREAIKILNGTGIPTHMHNTFSGKNSPGTIVQETKSAKNSPLVGVTGIKDMLSISLAQIGLDDTIGITAELYQLLSELGISYEHTATATDNVTIYATGQYKQNIHTLGQRFLHTGIKLNILNTSMVHIVGDGIAKSSKTRLEVLGNVALGFASAGVEVMGFTGVADSVAITYFIKPSDYNKALGAAHMVIGTM